MKLRKATIADVPLLMHWDEQPHVIACSGENDACDWYTELSAAHDWFVPLIAELDGRPVGFVQIIDPALEESHYWGDVADNLRAIDIWIGDAGDLSKGYGTAMMHLAHEHCFQNESITEILIDPLASNHRAHRFYERLGYEKVGPCRFGMDDCIVYKLTRATWEQRASN